MLPKPFLLLLFTLYLQNYCQGTDGPLVNTSLGLIQGYWKNSHGGKTFSTFEGIPYAKPPVGERRFEQPEPPEAWKNIFIATSLSTCPQLNMRNQSIFSGQEDCLHINIYVPREHPNAQENLDVIVHIHGGAFMYGSGHKYADPQYFMDRDVIFVTFNYRLGILGFLSTEDEIVPGNNGLKDQVMALVWVQNHIANFGGNPNSVTITGISAGGASVHLHYLSKMSKGLFHRGIAQSGVALNPWVIKKEPLNQTKILAENLNCPTNSTLALVQCLKTKSYKDIIVQRRSLFEYMIFPIVLFGPVIEKGDDAFLNKDPYQLLMEGQVQDLPWIASTTAHDGSIFTEFLEKDIVTVNDKWEDLAPILLDYKHSLTQLRWKSTAKKIKEFYLSKYEDINKDNLLRFMKMFTDRCFVLGTEDALRLQANVTKSFNYYYFFNYPGDNSLIVSHGHERKFLFGFNNTSNSRHISPNELKMKNVLLDMFISFAKTSKPDIGVRWDPVKYDELKYLNISSFEEEGIKLQSANELTPKKFWKSLGLLEDENLVSLKNCC